MRKGVKVVKNINVPKLWQYFIKKDYWFVLFGK